jgi:hypothetical protein
LNGRRVAQIYFGQLAAAVDKFPESLRPRFHSIRYSAANEGC